MKKFFMIFVLLVVIGIIAIVSIVIGCKAPAFLHIERLKMPEGVEIINKTTVNYSDEVSDHIEGEKIIKCDAGYDYVLDFINKNNDEKALENISIGRVDVERPFLTILNNGIKIEDMSEKEKDKYVLIIYYKEI